MQQEEHILFTGKFLCDAKSRAAGTIVTHVRQLQPHYASCGRLESARKWRDPVLQKASIFSGALFPWDAHHYGSVDFNPANM